MLPHPQDIITVVYDFVTVGDEDHCMRREAGGKALEQKSLGLSIKCRAEFIQQQDGAGAKKCSGDGYTLSLSF